MSAWVPMKEHIDLLVQVALVGPRDIEDPWLYPGEAFGVYHDDKRFELHTIDFPKVGVEVLTPDALGQLFTEEVVESVSFRYPSDDVSKGELPGPILEYAYYLKPYTWTDPRYRPTIAETFKLTACYGYQACEHPEWEKSLAHGFCIAIDDRCKSRIPGYNAAPWGWDADDLAHARANA